MAHQATLLLSVYFLQLVESTSTPHKSNETVESEDEEDDESTTSARLSMISDLRGAKITMDEAELAKIRLPVTVSRFKYTSKGSALCRRAVSRSCSRSGQDSDSAGGSDSNSLRSATTDGDSVRGYTIDLDSVRGCTTDGDSMRGSSTVGVSVRSGKEPTRARGDCMSGVEDRLYLPESTTSPKPDHVGHDVIGGSLPNCG